MHSRHHLAIAEQSSTSSVPYVRSRGTIVNPEREHTISLLLATSARQQTTSTAKAAILDGSLTRAQCLIPSTPEAHTTCMGSDTFRS